ncbi:MAG: toprim domain-containing protein [Desulfobacterales bacterium]|nr:toprim domain-containing protein [Desulfobacterales bacterium]
MASTTETKIPENKFQQLVSRALEIYEKNFTESAQARKYLESRGITNQNIIAKHKIGFCSGKLKDTLSTDVKLDLRNIGILYKNDVERFFDHLIIPIFDMDGRIITIYGRHINQKRHSFLPDRPTGIWNIKALKLYPEIFIVESPICGLTLESIGFPNVVAINGVNGLSENDVKFFKTFKTQKIILLLDGDAPGRNTAKRLKEEKLSGFNVEIRNLPDGHDPNSILVQFGKEKLVELINPASDTDSKETSDINFVLNIGRKTYKVYGIERAQRKLKAVVRVEGASLHIETMDFYQSRDRKKLCQEICRKFNDIPETVEAEVDKLMLKCEEYAKTKATQPVEPSPYTMTEKERLEAVAFGKNPDLIKLITQDFEKCGLIGEEANKILGYIVMSSRKLPSPLALLILSSSGAGKSALQDAIVDFCPDEDLVKITNLSGKALFYKNTKSLAQKVLALEEGAGAEDAFYAIRSLISAGELYTETTIKDPATGKLVTMQNKVEGPTAILYTTSNPATDPEMASRCFIVGIDESREQTRKILQFQKESHLEDEKIKDIEREAIIKKHKNFQRLLKPIAIKNPYSTALCVRACTNFTSKLHK